MKTYIILLFSILFVPYLNAQFGQRQIISPSIRPVLGTKTFAYASDINGDGFLDIICKSNDYEVPGWINNEGGEARFVDFQAISQEGKVNLFYPVDLDLDGDIDIICTYQSDEKVVWFENLDGAGHFGGAQFIAELNTAVNFINSGDIDGDGDIDIVYASQAGPYLGWFENLGDSFSEVVEVDATAIGARQVYPTDADMDGDLDLIAGISYLDDKVVYYENLDGAGNFDVPQVIEIDIGTYRTVEIADLDADGDDDVISAGLSIVAWYENNGDGTFGEQQILSDDINEPHDVSAGDLDADGDLDLIACYYWDRKTVWFENTNGQADFSQPITITEDDIEYYDHLIVDLDNDGDQDLLSRSFYGRRTVILEKLEGVGNYAPENPISIESDNITSANLLDLDNDGKKDILATSEQNTTLSMGTAWYKNLDGAHHFSTTNNISNSIKVLDYGDMDGDGDIDILAKDSITFSINKKLIWLKNEGTGSFSDPLILNNSITEHQKLVDIDGDNDLDIFFYDPHFSSEEFKFYENDGSGNFSPEAILFSFEDESDVVCLKDVNGDGFSDLVIGYNYPFEIVWFENLSGSGTFGPETPVINTQTNSTYIHFELFDFDADGDLDVLLSNRFEDEVFWTENTDGLGSFGSKVILLSDVNAPELVQSVDIDGDGMLDIVFSSGYDGKIEWYQQDSSGTFHGPAVIDDYLNVKSMIFSDIDQDGDKDFLTAQSDEIVFYENYTNNPQVQGTVFWDQNENGLKDSSEVGLFQQVITLRPYGIVNFSSGIGNYHFAVDPGIYEIDVATSPGWAHTGDSLVSLEVLAGPELIKHDFGLKVINPEIQINTDISSAPTRCGFTVPFWIAYENAGATYMDGIVHLEADSLLSFVNAYPVPDSIVGLHYYWSFENLTPTHADQIRIDFLMPGVEYLGDTISMFSDVLVYDSMAMTAFADSAALISEINCAYDPNDKLVEPNFPGFDNYTLFGDTLIYTIRFQNTGTDTAFTVRLEDDLDANLDLSTFKVISSSHPNSVSLLSSGKLTFLFENILLPPSIEDEPRSNGYVKYRIVPKEGLAENTPISNEAGIFFDFNPPIFTNKVTNILVEQYPLLADIIQPSCFNTSDGAILTEFPFFPVTYSWENGSVDNERTGLSNGSYQLSITDQQGMLVLDTMFVLNNSDSVFITTNEIIHVDCYNENTGQVLLSGASSYLYEWSDGTTGANNQQLPAGVHMITVTDSNGCTIEESFTITQPEALVLTGDANPENNNEMNGEASVEASGGVEPYTYAWNTEPVQNTATAVNLSAGLYTVTVTDANGCIQIEEVEVDQIVANNELQEQYRFEVSPNPTEGAVKIDIAFIHDTFWTLKITDINGRLVEVFENPDGKNEHSIVLESLLEGVYNISLITDNNIRTLPLIVIR